MVDVSVSGDDDRIVGIFRLKKSKMKRMWKWWTGIMSAYLTMI